MSKLTLASLIVLASTSAFAKNADLAYGQSGTHAGGPAGLLISNTGGPVLRRAGVHRNPAYAYAGTHAGGPADLPPISFPGCPERWWGDEALKAETDAPQATLEQRHQAAGDILALHCRGFFFGGGVCFQGRPTFGWTPPNRAPTQEPG